MSSTTEKESPAALVRSVFQTIFSGDFAPFDSHPGLAALKQHFPPMLVAFPDFHAELKQQIVDGDRVGTHWVFRGTHLGEFQGIPPTGRPVEFQNLSISRVIDGRIVNYNSEIGFLTVLRQIGALPLPRH